MQLYTYFKNNVYLIFLLPHMSHILQPLDLMIFSPVKSVYRKEVKKLYIQSDTTPFGKAGFLECLCLARIKGLSLYNVKSGWRTSDLWPLNANIPLRNSKLLTHQQKLLSRPTNESLEDLKTP